MSRFSLSWPLSIIAGFAIFVALLLVGTSSQEATAQDTNCKPYPGCYQTAVVASKTAAAAAKTSAAGTDTARTQLALQGTCVRDDNEQYPCPTEPPTDTPEGGGNDGGNNGGNNNSGNNNGGNNAQPTSTFTATPTPTLTGAATTPTTNNRPDQIDTPTPSSATSPADEAGDNGTPTPTPALPPGVAALACVPGETVEFTGEAVPNTALLLFFGERAVGGGVSDANGAYRLRLQVGDERPGLYLVDVRERAGGALVDQYGCQVPSFTPTPTPVQ